MEFNSFKGKFTIFQAKQLNPIVLAFIGDAVYEVFIRMYLLDENREFSAHKLHLHTVNFVKAKSQSNFVKKLQNILTKDECLIFKRGRNAKSGSVPRNANIQDYRNATGFEAIIGFLYITEQIDRINKILNSIIEL